MQIYSLGDRQSPFGVDVKTLPLQAPTAEQLPIIQNTTAGVSVIRGAAGSGKTTTALLRLRQLTGFWLSRRQRMELVEPVRVLVITYNRTLRGYVFNLAEQQVGNRSNLELTVSTFAKLSKDIVGATEIVDSQLRENKLSELSGPLPQPTEFLLGEIDYAIGRFQPDRIHAYIDCERTGRGPVPRVTKRDRERIITEVIAPYNEWKTSIGKRDWNDLAVEVAHLDDPPEYDIIIADESQDLSANEVRGLMKLAADPSSVTFILDAAQRIYPRGFTWKEVGITIRPSDTYRLKQNHRNTVEICQFAEPLLAGMEIGDDGTFPDFKSCDRHGPMPVVLVGRFSQQFDYAIDFIEQHVDLANDSVGFLHALGGGWFREFKRRLATVSYRFVEISRQSEWPTGPENIALSTMHSAKGLEFDHVLILGLNAEVTPFGRDDEDDQGEELDAESRLRRLLAMAVTRARKSVVIGYKPGEASELVDYFKDGTFEEVTL